MTQVIPADDDPARRLPHDRVMHSPADQSRRPRTVAVVVVTAVLASLVTVIALVLVAGPKNHVVRAWDQPASVTYPDGREHHLAVLRRGTSLGAVIPLDFLQPQYVLYTGSDPGYSYGHFVDVTVTGGSFDGATTEWMADGVRLTLTSGHEVFVPADAFTGGR